MSISNYLNETKAELKHVNWPSKAQTFNYTIIVIAVSVVIALALGLFDFIFNTLLKFVL